jgi:hypothetical protein
MSNINEHKKREQGLVTHGRQNTLSRFLLILQSPGMERRDVHGVRA